MDGSEKGKHYDLPQMEYYKVEAVRQAISQSNDTLMPVGQYRLVPKPNKSRFPNFSKLHRLSRRTDTSLTRMLVSIDGEHAPFEPFQVEVHPGFGKVLSLRQSWYLPPEWYRSPQ